MRTSIIGVILGATLVCTSALRTKLASALRARTPLLSGSAGTVRWTLAPEQAVRAVLSADTKAILEAAWASDAELKSFAERGGNHFAQPLVQTAHGLEMHGAIAWAEGAGLPQGRGSRPGVMLVHTAVGPQDLFLRWRAQTLASRGYVVLIADLLGDPLGSGWDATFGGPARQVYADDRTLLLKRTRAALDGLADGHRLVDRSRLAAMGFCFGGRAVADLLKSNPPNLRGMLAFHGTGMDDYAPAGFPAAGSNETIRARAFVATASADPFAPRATLDGFLALLTRARCAWEMQVYGGKALHAFTNPAQAINERAEFDYDEKAAAASWAAAELFLDDVFR